MSVCLFRTGLRIVHGLTAAALFALPVSAAHAQDAPAPAPACPKGQTLQPSDADSSKQVCKTAKPAPVDQFPYPGDPAPAAPKSTAKPADAFPYPGDPAATPSAPAPVTKAKPASPADQFPYPGDTPPAAPAPASKAKPASPVDQFPYPGDPAATEKPAKPPAPGDAFPYPGDPASPSSSPSSSSSSSSTPADPDKPALKDEGSEGEVAGHHASKKPLHVQTADEREAEDVRIASYYRSTGNMQATYMRSKDAVSIAPDDYEAFFLLGESAQALKKKDEAVSAYREYLKLDPGGKHEKAALSALQALGEKL